VFVGGDRGEEGGAAAVRLRSEENLGAMPIADFLALVEPLVATRSLALK
jgi:threonyl-tRNA synthetase